MTLLEEIQAEIDEKELDLKAFSRAREIIRSRMLEVRDSPSHLTPLLQWSGTDAVSGSLDLAIHSMERTLNELKKAYTEVKSQERKLRIVRADDE